MTAVMPEVLTAGVLALAALLACARLLHGHQRRDRSQTTPRWKLPLLLAAQPLLAALLYFGLFPPARPVDAGLMTVYTAGAKSGAADAGTLRIALPEACASSAAGLMCVTWRPPAAFRCASIPHHVRSGSST